MPEQDMATEDALFDNAVDEGNATPAAEPEALPPAVAPEQPTEQPRPDATTAAPDASTPVEADDDAAMVPSARLRDVTKEKRAAEAERDAIRAELAAARRERDRIDYERQEYQQRLAKQQAQQPAASEPEAPDPLLYPKEYREFIEKRFEERLINRDREHSLQLAKRTYKDEFKEAYEIAATQAQQGRADPVLMTRMQQSEDPGETLMQWFRELKIRHEVGNDLGAYQKKVREEAMKDPEFRKAAIEAWRGEAPAQTNGRPNIQLAPSLNGISRSNAALRASQGDVSDDDLWDSTTT
jgi:hypothetical protein